jgi:AcrR family transcriptional regulator
MATTASDHHRRRTQAERSAATREALLDATVACLIEDGYASTTTSRVAERAGVSRGAHLHHFQTRSALVAAAIRHLSWRRGRELHAAVEDLPEGEGRVAAALDLLWATYSSPLFAAALDLWSHARTDPELRERLVAVDRALDAETLGLARRLFPEAAAREDFEGLVETSLAAIRGLALENMLDPGGERSAELWPYTRGLLVGAFAKG